ncbi:unnamed protein product [Acanthoscelides obtectus]|uniref:Uncharacterized protein n=1 Tax=Acanthoscelides obtectus TaxID=200917 RepID=A0A9P0K1A2_ACAOB|nr:unnamed protein product [Acanthoscelides obtectus]CAK1639483.1 hypothetical protein AOBTE_LOCUS11209 [Acanthoscelides obtectus]
MQLFLWSDGILLRIVLISMCASTDTDLLRDLERKRVMIHVDHARLFNLAIPRNLLQKLSKIQSQTLAKHEKS